MLIILWTGDCVWKASRKCPRPLDKHSPRYRRSWWKFYILRKTWLNMAYNYMLRYWKALTLSRVYWRSHSMVMPHTPIYKINVLPLPSLLSLCLLFYKQVIVCDRLHASILALLMNIPHVIVDGGVNSTSYGKRVFTRATAFNTSDYCTPETLRYRDATTLEEGISKGIELLEDVFGKMVDWKKRICSRFENVNFCSKAANPCSWVHQQSVHILLWVNKNVRVSVELGSTTLRTTAIFSFGGIWDIVSP